MSAQAEMPTVLDRRSLAFVEGPATILLAGMRARRVADACAAEGLAAVLLDAGGRVLHVGDAAKAMLGDEFRIEADHVLGRDDGANAAIEAVLNPILGRRGDLAPHRRRAPLRVARAGALAVAALDYADDLPGQILRAILILGPDGEALAEAAARLRF